MDRSSVRRCSLVLSCLPSEHAASSNVNDNKTIIFNNRVSPEYSMVEFVLAVFFMSVIVFFMSVIKR